VGETAKVGLRQRGAGSGDGRARARAWVRAQACSDDGSVRVCGGDGGAGVRARVRAGEREGGQEGWWVRVQAWASSRWCGAGNGNSGARVCEGEGEGR